jgi:hypothetical protein
MRQLLLLIPLVLLISVACKREKAVWESDWQAPLLKDTLRIDDWVNTSYLTVNAGYYELSLNRTVFEMGLSDLVEIPDTTVEHTYSISLSSFNVPPGASFVNNIEEHEIALGDVELKKIRVKSGGISIAVLNPIGTKCFFTVELPGVTKNGVTLSQDFTALAGSNANPYEVTGYVDLAGYEMDLRGASLGSFNKIQSKMLVTSDPNGQMVTITNQDIIKFEFTMNNVELDYARGYFGNQVISDTTNEYIEELGKIVSGLIDLPTSSLQLEIVNGMKVSAKVMLTELTNTNAQGNAVSLSHPAIGSWTTVNSATGTENALNASSTFLEFNAQNSNLEQLLENHGALNAVGYQVQLNPWGNVSGGWDEIFPQSKLKVNLSGHMPLSIGLDDLILQDTFDFSFKQDFTKTHIAGGTIWLKATNAFPMNADVTIYLMNSQGNTIAAITGSDLVQSSVYGNYVNGVEQKQSVVEFVIPDSVIDQMEGVTQLLVKVRLNTPDESSNMSEQVQIPEGAFFGFRIGAKLKVEARL